MVRVTLYLTEELSTKNTSEKTTLYGQQNVTKLELERLELVPHQLLKTDIMLSTTLIIIKNINIF